MHHIGISIMNLFSRASISAFVVYGPEKNTVMTPSFRTDWSEQIVQTQIRLLLEEQSDQGLHCLLLDPDQTARRGAV